MSPSHATLKATHLLNGIWPVETPSPVHIRLPHFLASITTATFGFHAAVARATVAALTLLVDLVEVVLQLGNDGVGNGDTALIEAGLEDVVCDVRLSFAADVHNIKAQH